MQVLWRVWMVVNPLLNDVFVSDHVYQNNLLPTPVQHAGSEGSPSNTPPASPDRPKSKKGMF